MNDLTKNLLLWVVVAVVLMVVFQSFSPKGGNTAAMAGGGGSSQPLVIELNIAGRSFGQLWIDTGKREIKTRGGDVQAVLGKG